MLKLKLRLKLKLKLYSRPQANASIRTHHPRSHSRPRLAVGSRSARRRYSAGRRPHLSERARRRHKPKERCRRHHSSKGKRTRGSSSRQWRRRRRPEHGHMPKRKPRPEPEPKPKPKPKERSLAQPRLLQHSNHGLCRLWGPGRTSRRPRQPCRATPVAMKATWDSILGLR